MKLVSLFRRKPEDEHNRGFGDGRAIALEFGGDYALADFINSANTSNTDDYCRGYWAGVASTAEHGAATGPKERP